MRRRKRHRVNRKARRIFRLTAWALVIVLCLMAFDSRIRPVVTTMAQYQCRSASVGAMNEAVMEVLQSQGDLYNQLINISRNADGTVASLSVNTVTENSFKALLTQAVSDKLEAMKKQPVQVPLGTLMDWQLMAGRGPDITMQILPTAFVQSNTLYTFESAGINQTHHRIYIQFTVEMSAILPGYSTSVTVETEICIAQTLIVGQVPQFYAAGNVASA